MHTEFLAQWKKTESKCCISGKFMYELWLHFDKGEESTGLIQLVKKCIFLKIHVLWMQNWIIKEHENRLRLE